jgi:hypothetical protein
MLNFCIDEYLHIKMVPRALLLRLPAQHYSEIKTWEQTSFDVSDAF